MLFFALYSLRKLLLKKKKKLWSTSKEERWSRSRSESLTLILDSGVFHHSVVREEVVWMVKGPSVSKAALLGPRRRKLRLPVLVCWRCWTLIQNAGRRMYFKLYSTLLILSSRETFLFNDSSRSVMGFFPQRNKNASGCWVEPFCTRSVRGERSPGLLAANESVCVCVRESEWVLDLKCQFL